MTRRKILLVSVYHPDIVRGGAQQACYELFAELRGTDWQPLLLASTDRNVSPALYKSGAVITAFDGRSDEYLFLSEGYDHDWHRSREPRCLEMFEAFLESTAPDVIHFHHFMTFGMEYLTAARKYLDGKGGRLIFTLHEFLAMCMASGQMVRTFDQSLCDTPSSLRCHECFPGFPPEHFSMRRMWIKHHLGRVHQFIAPSDFLRQRYIEWGIPAEKIVVIPNGHRPLGPDAAPTVGSWLPDSARNRFAYFGQLVDNKGLLVLFDAVKLLRSRGLHDFTLDVYGSNLQFASQRFRNQFNAFWAAEKSANGSGEARVRFRGGYRHADLPKLMRGVDWVIVPSTWWEIFGMVVSEAFLFGKPVICSKIGAIGERVQDNIDGLHFRVGDAESLAATMARAMTEKDLWNSLHANVKPPPTAGFVARQHIEQCYGVARPHASPRN